MRFFFVFGIENIGTAKRYSTQCISYNPKLSCVTIVKPYVSAGLAYGRWIHDQRWIMDRTEAESSSGIQRQRERYSVGVEYRRK